MLFPIAVRLVRLGRPARAWVFGDSMTPVIESGQRVKIEPLRGRDIELGDVVAVMVNGETMLHLVSEIDVDRGRVKIAGTSGPPNGWTRRACVFGICTEIGGVPVAVRRVVQSETRSGDSEGLENEIIRRIADDD
jgi:hypothetical protein